MLLSYGKFGLFRLDLALKEAGKKASVGLKRREIKSQFLNFFLVLVVVTKKYLLVLRDKTSSRRKG